MCNLYLPPTYYSRIFVQLVCVILDSKFISYFGISDSRKYFKLPTLYLHMRILLYSVTQIVSAFVFQKDNIVSSPSGYKLYSFFKEIRRKASDVITKNYKQI